MKSRQLQKIAKELRRDIVKMVYASKSGHLGCSLGIVDILTVLYFHALRIDPFRPNWLNRDKFILSKGHGVSALYATLAKRGFFDKKLLDTYMQNGSYLAGHVTRGVLPGIEATAGALGHGLSVGIGMALAIKKEQLNSRIFVLVGDGESQEGSVWEGILFAGHHKINNLILVIDYNNLQILGKNSDIVDLMPLSDKLTSFRWDVKTVDGNNIQELISVFELKNNAKPLAIIAKTTKGKGVSFIENKVEWHTLTPSTEQFTNAITELT